MSKRAGRDAKKAPWVEVKQKNSGKLKHRRGGSTELPRGGKMPGRYRLLALKCDHEVVRQCRQKGLQRARCRQCQQKARASQRG